MSNMSYCRFENTTGDMQDCINAIEEAEGDVQALIAGASSEYESAAMRRFIKLCQQVAEAVEDEEIYGV